MFRVPLTYPHIFYYNKQTVIPAPKGVFSFSALFPLLGVKFRSLRENRRCPECRSDNKEGIHVDSNRGDSPQSAPSARSLHGDGEIMETESGVSDDTASFTAGAKESEVKRVVSTPEVQILPRTRFLVFGAIFYILLLSYLVIVLFFPQSRVARFSAVFDTFWAQFIFLVLCFRPFLFCV
jgi:hypothetical protein